MPIIIPVNSDGNREIEVNTGARVFRFRTYYTKGQYPSWYLDIKDADGNPLRVGLRITAGCPNLLKGLGNKFTGYQLTVAVISGKENDPNGLGVGTFLLWYNPGEVNDFQVGDPMVDVSIEDWNLHNV